MVNKNTIGDALKRGIALLKKSNIPGAATDAAVLLGHALDWARLHLTIHRDDAIDPCKEAEYMEFINRRCNNEPVSYITGQKEFMSLDFKVEKGVLIPRPDTEILVETVMDKLKDIPNPVIIDMCTGSGAIAISLAKYIQGSRVTALDVSEIALRVAKENAVLNVVDVVVEKHDVLTPYSALADAVVSNPPYIPTEVIEELDSDVSDYEPHLALDGGEDGLVFYRAIVQNIGSALKKDGLLAFEVGHDQAEDVAMIMQDGFYGIDTAKDLAGIERVVYGFLR